MTLSPTYCALTTSSRITAEPTNPYKTDFIIFYCTLNSQNTTKSSIQESSIHNKD
jgi:hypothetical protein